MPQPVLDGQTWLDLIAEEMGESQVGTGIYDRDYRDQRGSEVCAAFSKVPRDSCGVTAELLLRAAEDRAADRIEEAGWSFSAENLQMAFAEQRAELLEHLIRRCGDLDGCGFLNQGDYPPEVYPPLEPDQARPSRPSNASGWLKGALVLGTALGLGYAFYRWRGAPRASVSEGPALGPELPPGYKAPRRRKDGWAYGSGPGARKKKRKTPTRKSPRRRRR